MAEAGFEEFEGRSGRIWSISLYFGVRGVKTGDLKECGVSK
jgi:hypothetical protein